MEAVRRGRPQRAPMVCLRRRIGALGLTRDGSGACRRLTLPNMESSTYAGISARKLLLFYGTFVHSNRLAGCPGLACLQKFPGVDSEPGASPRGAEGLAVVQGEAGLFAGRGVAGGATRRDGVIVALAACTFGRQSPVVRGPVAGKGRGGGEAQTGEPGTLLQRSGGGFRALDPYFAVSFAQLGDPSERFARVVVNPQHSHDPVVVALVEDEPKVAVLREDLRSEGRLQAAPTGFAKVSPPRTVPVTRTVSARVNNAPARSAGTRMRRRGMAEFRTQATTFDVRKQADLSPQGSVLWRQCSRCPRLTAGAQAGFASSRWWGVTGRLRRGPGPGR